MGSELFVRVFEMYAVKAEMGHVSCGRIKKVACRGAGLVTLSVLLVF